MNVNFGNRFVKESASATDGDDNRNDAEIVAMIASTALEVDGSSAAEEQSAALSLTSVMKESSDLYCDTPFPPHDDAFSEYLANNSQVQCPTAQQSGQGEGRAIGGIAAMRITGSQFAIPPLERPLQRRVAKRKRNELSEVAPVERSKYSKADIDDAFAEDSSESDSESLAAALSESDGSSIFTVSDTSDEASTPIAADDDDLQAEFGEDEDYENAIHEDEGEGEGPGSGLGSGSGSGSGTAVGGDVEAGDFGEAGNTLTRQLGLATGRQEGASMGISLPRSTRPSFGSDADPVPSPKNPPQLLLPTQEKMEEDNKESSQSNVLPYQIHSPKQMDLLGTIPSPVSSPAQTTQTTVKVDEVQALPPGWTKCFSKREGRDYWFNSRTGKSSWTYPTS